MPLSLPVITDVEHVVTHGDNHPAPRNHRRSYSNSRFSNEKSGPGAFTPINNLPRRKSTPTPPPRPARPMFHLLHDSSDSDDDQQHIDPAPRLTVDTLNTPVGSIPFPTSGPASPRTSRSISPLPSPLPRTPSSSTPILLANGKPLRPSLKSSNSSPHLPPAARQDTAPHLRSQSAPSSPNLSPDSDDHPPAPTPKNVHFKDDGGLETVRVFNKAGKPASISKEEETETETEGYDSSSGPPRFPFPTIIPSSPLPAPAPPPLALAPPPLTTPIPCQPPTARVLPPPHILVASLALTRAPPYSLRGTLLVLNIAYEKRVSVRFTLDDWCTTSEVGAAWGGAGALPPAWARRCGAVPAYDTFTFSISLHDLYLSGTLPARVLFLAAKYIVPGAGEWWDNNRGDNFRVGFQPAGAGARPAMAGRSLSEPAVGVRRVRPKADRETPKAPLEKAPASVSRGTGFSSIELPSFVVRGKTDAAPTHPRLTLRNYASPGERASPLPTPPASRTSSMLDMPVVGGHPATAVPEPPPPPAKDSYAALLARWCFHTGPAEVEKQAARWESLGMA